MLSTRTLLATALAAVTLASPAAAQESPRPQQWQPPRDQRSPDARDAALAASSPEPAERTYRDLRSPDTRDAAEGRSMAVAASPIIEITRASGFDWGDAVIGAGGAIGILAISLAGAMTVRRHKTSPRSGTALV